MAIVRLSDFDGELSLPNVTQEYGAAKLNWFISKYEKEYLIKTFGKEMGSLFIDALTETEVVLTYENVSSITINDWYNTYFEIFGNNPVFTVNQVLGNGSKRRRNDVVVNPSFTGGILQSVTLDLGSEISNAEVLITKPYTNTETLYFDGSVNPTEIESYQDVYAEQFGNNPLITVYEVDGDNRQLRNDAGITLTYSGDLMQSISVDFGETDGFEVTLYGNAMPDNGRFLNLVDDSLRRAIAGYVYWHFVSNDYTYQTGTGTVKQTAQNATPAPPKYKMVKAWNDMVDINREIAEGIDTDIYPEFVKPYWLYGRCRNDVYAYQNRVGI